MKKEGGIKNRQSTLISINQDKRNIYKSAYIYYIHTYIYTYCPSA